MKKYKNTIFYTSVILIFSALMYFTAVTGKKLETDVMDVISHKSNWQEFIDSFMTNLHHPLAILLLQIVTIVIVARFFGWIFNKIGQPSVIGEIIAGIVLGPSLFGMYFPETSAALFPLESLGNLQFFSQIGLILFMFVIGMELDLKVLKQSAHDAVVISHASIIIPFALGMVLAYFIYESFAPEGINFLSFSLFMGIAMSITAFPVLARIVTERGIHKTKLGTVVLTAAAADDITAWCILAVVIAIVKAGSFVSALYVIAMALIYVFLMLKVVRPFMARIGKLNENKSTLSKPVVAIFLLILVISSYATEIIGIHALFGAFMAGAIMPENHRFRNIFVEKVEDVALVLFLPLFFVYTGLRTQIGLLNDIDLWKIAGAIIFVAVVGKFIGSALAAKFVGQSWRDSLTIGALMNTRGLMELIALNIGYELGVLTPEVFAMMVIMALVTTFMTGPAIDLINKIFKDSKNVPENDEVVNHSKYKILFAFNGSSKGKNMLRIANSLSKNQPDNSIVTAMHLAASGEVFAHEPHYEEQRFTPIIEESKRLNQKVNTLFKVSLDMDSDILEVANKGEYDLLIIGLGESIYDGTILGKLLGYTTRFVNPDYIVDKVTGKQKWFDSTPFDDSTKHILANSKLPVGIFIDKGMKKVDKIFIPIKRKEDIFLMDFIQRFIRNNDAHIVIMELQNVFSESMVLKDSIYSLSNAKPNNVSIITEDNLKENFFSEIDLILVSNKTWKKMVENKKHWLADPTTSVLVMKS